MAQLVEHCPVYRRVASLIPSWGTCPGFGLRRRPIGVSLSPFLPVLNLSCFTSESQIIWLGKSLMYITFIRVYLEIDFSKNSSIRKYVENNKKKEKESFTFPLQCPFLLKLLPFIWGSLGRFPFGFSHWCFRKPVESLVVKAIIHATLTSCGLSHELLMWQ